MRLIDNNRANWSWYHWDNLVLLLFVKTIPVTALISRRICLGVNDRCQETNRRANRLVCDTACGEKIPCKRTNRYNRTIIQYDKYTTGWTVQYENTMLARFDNRNYFPATSIHHEFSIRFPSRVFLILTKSLPIPDLGYLVMYLAVELYRNFVGPSLVWIFIDSLPNPYRIFATLLLLYRRMLLPYCVRMVTRILAIPLPILYRKARIRMPPPPFLTKLGPTIELNPLLICQRTEITEASSKPTTASAPIALSNNKNTSVLRLTVHWVSCFFVFFRFEKLRSAKMERAFDL